MSLLHPSGGGLWGHFRGRAFVHSAAVNFLVRVFLCLAVIW